MGAHVLAATLPAPGDVLDGKYRVLGVIGEGGMGVVFEATHVRLGQRVAIKMLQPELAASADVVSRFEREARAAGRLRGRNVARVSDVEVSAGKLPYMVMEFLEGHDLATELEMRGRLTVEDAVGYVMQAARGIAEAHDAGIVHRDLKPSNLFLCNEGAERIVKLLDFGISKMADEASKLTTTQLTVGTLLYMSPEQVRSAKDVDARTDIWALGVILYELLAGDPPFVGSGPAVAAAIVADATPSLAEARPDLPPELVALVEKSLAKKPGDRFPDVTAFAAALAPFAPSGALAPTSGAFSLRLAAVPASAPRVVDATAETQLGAVPVVRHAAPSAGGTSPSVAPPLHVEAAPGAPRSSATGPGWATAPARRGSRWLAVAAAGVVGTVAVAAVVAVLVVRRHPAREADRAAAAATTTATTATTGTSAPAVPTTSTESSATSASSATAEAPGSTGGGSAPAPASSPVAPHATKKTAHAATNAAPTTQAPSPPAPPSANAKKRDEKPPLVAPF